MLVAVNEEIAARRDEVLAEIARLGPCLPGSLTERTIACASHGCHCHEDPSKRHGPYRLWTRKLAGKTVTRTLTKEQQSRYRAWFDNKRRLDELVSELEQLSVLEMANNEHWPQPPSPPPDRRRVPRRGSR
jgi:hypothetical protein